MTDFLPTPAPGFDQPIAFLKSCHDKIRKQITTLQNLLHYLPQHGASGEAQQAASAVLKYFDRAAHLHHEDEEENLMPMLLQSAGGDDAALLATLVPEILADHEAMDLAWESIAAQLRQVADASSAQLDAQQVERFTAAYTAHMTKEEGSLAPMAKRLFTPQQMAQLGAAMQQRRAALDSEPGPSLADLRTDYSQASLLESDVLEDPIAQFGKWFEEALKAQVNEPNAMSLATVGADGKPSSRIVLVKQYDSRGFTWYTNYASRKGTELASKPYAALLFFWSELERQVRIEGRVIKTSEEESDHYFHSRPLKSRLAAIASAQSAGIASRDRLEANFAAVAGSHGEHPPRPPHWGGYRLEPERIEFWQGRRSRFHDRIVFTLQADGSWLRQRLQP
ncbi:MAG TPA: pyridoxamine 5'-phosphate oxidase [Janthinobacterium sp.]|nr:pyridoxamine 5'-phosphate oxidase [Janthinobacterium sp.]